jgi:hypothetical protein
MLEITYCVHLPHSRLASEDVKSFVILAACVIDFTDVTTTGCGPAREVNHIMADVKRRPGGQIGEVAR